MGSSFPHGTCQGDTTGEVGVALCTTSECTLLNDAGSFTHGAGAGQQNLQVARVTSNLLLSRGSETCKAQGMGLLTNLRTGQSQGNQLIFDTIRAAHRSF